MNKLLLTGVAACAAGSALAFAKVNPIPKMFPQNLTFLATFDDGTANPDVGVISPKAVPPCETADGGVIGKCLASRRCSYALDIDGKPFMDTLASGTVICWVRYVEDPPEGKRPGIFFFDAAMKNDARGKQRRLMMMQQADVSRMNALYQCMTDKMQSATATTRNDYREWKKGVWKMCVMTWTQDKIGFSHDGAPLYEVALGESFTELSSFTICAPDPAYNGKSRFFQVDECAILNRKLTDSEIKEVHSRFLGRDAYDGPIWVDNVCGDDANPGSKERPFKTLSKALSELRGGGELHLVNNEGKPYRERLGLGSRKSGTAGKPTVVDGHGSLIDGFLPADDWKDEGGGVFSRAHQNNAWAMDRDGCWHGGFEMVRFAGKDGQSVKSRGELVRPGQYFLKKGKLGPIANNTLFVKVRGGSTPAKDEVTMCSWDVNLTLYSCANVVVRNLRVAHQARDAFSTNYATNCLLDHVEGCYTMDQGVSSHCSVGMKVRSSRFHHCAGGGIVDVVMPKSDLCEVTYEDCTIDSNFQRTPVEFYGIVNDSTTSRGVYKMVRCRIVDNDLVDKNGVAVYADNRAEVSLVDCKIDGKVSAPALKRE